jgi:cell division protein FtsB
MKKQLLGHLLFWALLITIDLSGYIPVWRSIVGIVAAINYSWILLIFYSSYSTSVSLFSDERENIRAWHQGRFWVMALLPILYMASSYYTDKYVLHIYGAPSLWSYCVSRFMMIYPFIGGAILLAGFRTHAIQFRNIRKERNDLLIENNYLDEENVKLKQEREQLSREVHLLKFEAIASRQQVASIRREYDEKLEMYKQIIDRLKGDGDFQ